MRGRDCWLKMPRFSFSLVLSLIFIVYVSHSVWTIYQLYNPKPCSASETCLNPSWSQSTKFHFTLCTASKSSIHSYKELTPLWSEENFDIFKEHEINLNVKLPSQTLRNGTFFIHAFLYPAAERVKSILQILENPETSYGGCALTKYQEPESTAFNLLNGNQQEPKTQKTKNIQYVKPISHWKPKLTIHAMTEPLPLSRTRVPQEIAPFLKLSEKKRYLPVLYTSDLSYRIKELIPLNKSQPEMDLTLIFNPISVGRLRLMTTVEQAMKQMFLLGFTEKDTDEVKSIFFDTNIYLLLATCVVSGFHLLFDFLAFKNDISFWRHRKTTVGVSFRTLLYRCISQAIITFYLLDENTSLLVLVPSFIAAFIELWKVSKAMKMRVTFCGLRPSFEFDNSSDEEKLTEGFDSESMRYLSYLLYPLVICGAIYSLLYTPHKSWYSWCIKSLANGVYAFGFLFMLPQLFINYKLKSVSHLPWRAFMYKAFNTFIDDLFAFIITMPTAHRVACFRDDIVFVIYLYQRWLYPVDKKRVNEFGESYEKEKEN